MIRKISLTFCAHNLERLCNYIYCFIHNFFHFPFVFCLDKGGIIFEQPLELKRSDIIFSQLSNTLNLLMDNLKTAIFLTLSVLDEYIPSRDLLAQS